MSDQCLYNPLKQACQGQLVVAPDQAAAEVVLIGLGRIEQIALHLGARGGLSR